MAHVFINYARQDQAFVQRLARDLQSSGIEVWYDTLSLEAGDVWWKKIQEAVLNAGVFLNISTPSSNNSEWVKRELELAARRDVLIIPLILAESPTSLILRSRQWIDFRGDYQIALQKLIVALPISVKQGKPIPQEPPKSKGYVFISYSEKDTIFVKDLVAFLKERKYGYWDYKESERNYNTRLFSELEEVIRNASATLSILSPDWKTSEWAPREYLFAKKVGVPVFLLMAREMEPTIITIDMPYIDFQDTKQGFAELDRELRKKGLI